MCSIHRHLKNTKKEQHQYPFIFGHCMCRGKAMRTTRTMVHTFVWLVLLFVCQPRRASGLVSPWRPRRGLSPIFNSKEARPNFFRSTAPKPRAAPPPTTSSNLTPHEREEDDGFFLDIGRLDDQIEDLTIAPSSAFRSGFVSIVGNANVGKSTLLNAILGQKLNIVSPKPQTTRHGINGILTEANCQMVLTDTPGMLAPKYTMHEAMRDAIHDAVRDTDVVLLVTDVYGEALQDDGLMQRFAPPRPASTLLYANHNHL
jgi:small GTP-binding protein